MKTRSNMPLFVVECSDIKALSNSQIDLLRCGDYLVKKDASGEHAYKVSYKKDKVGICLTYCDGSGYIETASYDYTGGNWVFNSLDIFNGADLQGEIDDKQDKLVSGTNIKTINETSLLGSGNIAISGGTQLYKHVIQNMTTSNLLIEVISTRSTKYTSAPNFDGSVLYIGYKSTSQAVYTYPVVSINQGYMGTQGFGLVYIDRDSSTTAKLNIKTYNTSDSWVEFADPTPLQ